jgi:hypothetical protein
MMSSQLVALLVFSLLVSTVLALVSRSDARGRLRFGLIAFAAFVLSAFLVGWLMYPFPH